VAAAVALSSSVGLPLRCIVRPNREVLITCVYLSVLPSFVAAPFLGETAAAFLVSGYFFSSFSVSNLRRSSTGVVLLSTRRSIT
jgi:hypothetical protein